MAVALVDSSAIVGYLLADDVLHASAAEAIETTLSGGDSLAMSVVTWSETLHGALLGHFPEDVLREFAADFGIRILDIDVQIAEQAATLQRAYRETSTATPRPRLRTPDALILATSVVHADVEIVIGGDQQWAQVPDVDARLVLLAER